MGVNCEYCVKRVMVVLCLELWKCYVRNYRNWQIHVKYYYLCLNFDLCKCSKELILQYGSFLSCFRYHGSRKIFSENLMGCFLYKYHLHLKLSKSRTDDIVASPSIFRGQQVCSCSCALPDCVVVHSFSSRARASSSLAALHCTRPLPGLAWSCCSALCSVKLCCSFSVV